MQRYPVTRFNQRFPPVQFQYTQNQPAFEDFTFSQYRQSSQVFRPQNDLNDFLTVFDEKNSECIKKHSQALRNNHSTGTLEIIKVFESKSKELAEKMSEESKLLINDLKNLEKDCLKIKSSSISRTESILQLFSDLKTKIKLLKPSQILQSKNEKRKPLQSIKQFKKSK